MKSGTTPKYKLIVIAMIQKVLKTEAQYHKAIKRTLKIFHAPTGTPEYDELELLLLLVKDYEDKHIKLPNINPLEVIKERMVERGIKPKDLVSVIGSKGHVSSILSGRREITLNMAAKLKEYFQLTGAVFL